MQSSDQVNSRKTPYICAWGFKIDGSPGSFTPQAESLPFNLPTFVRMKILNLWDFHPLVSLNKAGW